jgi:TDG/mug DNA glycosylase family protein
LFVGINPGIKSAEVGHHYAGPGNRFWELLFQAKLVRKRVEYSDDVLLPGFGLGLTNLVDRPTRGSGDLSKRDFEVGRRKLRGKVLKFQPKIVAFVGTTAYRAYFDAKAAVGCGLALEKIGSSRVFVLPNTSGRNAHFSYVEMLGFFTGLAKEAAIPPSGFSQRRLWTVGKRV